MKQLTAFIKKEFTEQIRTGKLTIMVIIFVLFGIMSPAMAKLTPFIYEMLSDSMAEQGIIVQDMTVNAMLSWQQFYKNISLTLIVVVVMFCGILTNEYQKGTLVNMLTKGLSRWKVIIAKTVAAAAVWTICYWLCYLITYGYNAYFWDNSIARHLFGGAACIYLLGLWLIALILLGSALFTANFSVLLFTGGIFLAAYLMSLIPALAPYLPTQLLSSGNLLSGAAAPDAFYKAAGVTTILIVLAIAAAILRFNKKQL